MSKINESESMSFTSFDDETKQHEIESENDGKKDKRCGIPGFGIISVFISALFYALNVLFVKMIDLHPLQLSHFRVCIQFWILLPFLFHKRHAVDVLGHVGIRCFFWLQGFISASGMVFMYLALNHLTLGNTVTIAYLSMIMTPFFGKIFLKESLAVFDLVFAIVSLSGVILISKPAFLFPVQEARSSNIELGVMYATLSATAQSLSLITTRKMGQTTVPLSIVFCFSVSGALLTAILLFALEKFQLPCQQDLPLIFLLAISGVLAFYFLILALRYERTGTVGVLRSVQIIIVYLLQVVVLDDIPTTLDLIGAALVLSSSIGIGVRKILNEKKKKNCCQCRQSCGKHDK